MVASLLLDVRYALRSFRSTPLLAAAAVLSLALGIGANTSIFSVASALLLRPLPYADPDRLAILWNRSPGLGIEEDWFSPAQYLDIRATNTTFEHVAIALGGQVTVTGDGEPERIGIIRVSSSMLPLLGTPPMLGRSFTAEEDLGPSPQRVVILHHGTWQRRYGGDPGVIGRSMVINDHAHQIVGVMPPTFTLPREVMNTLGGAEEAELLAPLPFGPEAARQRNGEDYNILARLKQGASVAQAQAEMDALTARLRRDHPDFYPPNGRLTFSVVPLQQEVAGDVRTPLMILIAAVAGVLLIACANVANLIMSRALGRRRELAIRSAIGASRGRLVRQLLTESVVLALAGGLLGLAFAAWSTGAIHALGAQSIPRVREVRVDAVVLFFTAAVSLVAGLLVGLYPALQIGTSDARTMLAEGGRGTGAAATLWGRGGPRRILVACQLALCVMVLAAAGLLVRSFLRVQQVEPGFNPSGVLTFQLTMGTGKYPDPPSVYEGYRLAWDRLEQIPGVTAAGGITALPLSRMFAWGPIVVEGRDVPPEEKFINVDIRIVAGDYFGAMEIPLRRGRLFTEHDGPASTVVVVVDERMAEQLWPGEDPVGRRIRTGGFDARPDTPWMTVIGVAGRVKQYTLDEAEPRSALYLWHRQRPARSLNVVIRSVSADANDVAGPARAAVRELDPGLPIYNVKTMEARVGESMAQRRFAMVMLTLFSALALGLAVIGTYGVVAYLVSQGTHEIGIRMALGATPRRVEAMVLGGGLRIAAAGLTAGAAGALLVTRLMHSQLFGIGPADPLTFAVILFLIATVTLVATYIPARRASRIDPVEVLRS